MTKQKVIDVASVRGADDRGARIAADHPELVCSPSKTNAGAWESTLEEMMADERSDAQLVARIPTSLLERLDAYAIKLRKATGDNITRGDAVRLLLASALDREGIKSKKGRP
jgi:hypothetical protein